MSSTRQKILTHALKRFNEEGVETVGIRDLARDLGLSPGNVSYHFKKKDNLVAELASELAERNSGALSEQPADLPKFLEIYRAMFRNHIAYRFLMVSTVYLFEHNELMEGSYAEREQQRRVVLLERISNLRGSGGLRLELDEAQLRTIVAHLTLIVRMWMVEKRISFPHVDNEAAIDHYLHLLADIFAPHCTDEGARQLAPYLERALLS